MIRIAVIGYGYWGPSIARNFNTTDGCKVVAICDKSAASLQRASRDFPNVRLTCDFKAVLSSPDADAVAVVTPVWTHFELAESALRNGKHVFVEKPFTSTSAQAEQLIELAERKHSRLWWITRSCLPARSGEYGKWSRKERSENSIIRIRPE